MSGSRKKSKPPEAERPSGRSQAVRKAPTTKKRPRPRAKVFTHFSWVPNKKCWKCDYCSKTWADKLGSSNARQHLMANHMDISDKWLADAEVRLVALGVVYPASL